VVSTQPLRRAPVQARAKERLERVLDAAEQIFAEVGYEAATTNRIARRARTSIGSLYEFLGSKQAIAQALAVRYITDFRQVYARADVDASDGSRAIDQLVELVVGFYLRHPGLSPLLASAQGAEDLATARLELCNSLIAPVDHLLSHCQYSRDPAHRRRVAHLCVGILWTVAGEVAAQPPEDREELKAELKMLLTSYVTTAFPRPGPSRRGVAEALG
jgi:AcrR family transcriptional regulator